MDIKLDGLNNPGWSFTNERMYQLELMLTYINNLPSNEKFDYKEVQEYIERQSDIFNGSKIRMLFSPLKYYGVLNDYNKISTNGELLTDELGKGFLNFCYIYNKLDNQELDTEKKDAINAVYNQFMFKFYKNMYVSDKGAIYQSLESNLVKHKRISVNEFYVLTHAIKNEKSDDWVDETIKSMRENENNVKVEIISGKNAYNYISAFMVEAGIIKIQERIIYPDTIRNFGKVN